MAIDTRQKRTSAIDLTLPWRGSFPVPDGSISNSDRLQIGNLFATQFTTELIATTAASIILAGQAVASRNVELVSKATVTIAGKTVGITTSSTIAVTKGTITIVGQEVISSNPIFEDFPKYTIIGHSSRKTIRGRGNNVRIRGR